MSFCFLYNVVSENHSVQNSPWGGGGSIASSRSINLDTLKLSQDIHKMYLYLYRDLKHNQEAFERVLCDIFI